MRRRVLFLFIFLLSGFFIFAQNPKDISRIFSKSHDQNQRAIEYADGAVTLDLNSDLLQQVYNEDENHINITIPISENEDVTLDLHKFKILNDNFILRTSGGDTLKDYSPGLFYRGMIKDKEGIVTLSIFKNEIIGIISIKGSGNFNIGKIKETQNQYVVYNDRKVKVSKSFECHTPDTPVDLDNRETDNSIEVRDGNCVKIYLEGDYE